MRTTFIVLVLVTALAATCCTSPEDGTASKAKTIEATTTTQAAIKRSTPNYVGSNYVGSLLRIDPPVVPAEVGTREVVVHGSRLQRNHGMFVLACPNASLDDPTRPIQPTECGGLPMDNGWLDGKRASAEGTMANVTTGHDGTFTTPLTVDIDQAAIDAGGLVIRTGCLMVPSTESAILRID